MPKLEGFVLVAFTVENAVYSGGYYKRFHSFTMIKILEVEFGLRSSIGSSKEFVINPNRFPRFNAIYGADRIEKFIPSY